MYAGAIRLVGTEQGVGVRLAGDMAASGGDIRIDASGKLSLAQASSQGDLKIAAQAVELNGKTYAGGSAEIRSAEELVNRQSLAARERIVPAGWALRRESGSVPGARPACSTAAPRYRGR